MNQSIGTFAAIGVAALAFAATPGAHAAPNAAVDALENTPVSMLSYGLSALNEGVNGYLGRGAKPSPSAMFKAPLSGPVADFATTLFDQGSDTITINLIHIADLGTGTPDEACRQAFASLRLFALIAPLSGKPSPGMTESILPAFFSVDGTVFKPPANDSATLDQAFRLRFNGAVSGQRFRCTAPLLGTGYALELLK